MSAKFRNNAPPMVYVSYVGTAITGSVLVLSLTQLFMYEKTRGRGRKAEAPRRFRMWFPGAQKSHGV